MKLYRPLPIDEEMRIGSHNMMVTKTDMRGDIVYINDNFSSVVGYEKSEIIGTPHDALRHPDMPQVIFFLIGKAIENGTKIQSIVKNLTKSGEYYWAVTDFEPQIDRNGDISSFFAFREAIAEDDISIVTELYQTLLTIEKKRGVEASLFYLNSYLNEHKLNYTQFMQMAIRPKGLLRRIFVKNFAPKDEEKENYRAVA